MMPKIKSRYKSKKEKKSKMSNISNIMKTDKLDVPETHEASDDLPLINLVSWTAQATYSPKVDVDDCTICNETLTLCCSTCQDSVTNNIVCHVSMGKCGHCFHHHCISRWIEEGGGTCPLDKTIWKYECADCDYSDWKQLVKERQPPNDDKSKSITQNNKDQLKKLLKERIRVKMLEKNTVRPIANQDRVLQPFGMFSAFGMGLSYSN